MESPCLTLSCTTEQMWKEKKKTPWYWYTDRQVFIGTEGETYKPGRSISLYARWEKEEKDGQDNQDSNRVGNTNGKGDKNTLDKNKNTSGTVSGNTAGRPSDKNKDTDTATKTEGGNGNDGKGSEPVIQTGYASPFAFLAAIGLCGFTLAGASVLEAEKSRKGCLWRVRAVRVLICFTV